MRYQFRLITIAIGLAVAGCQGPASGRDSDANELSGRWEDIQTVSPRLDHQHIVLFADGKCLFKLYEYYNVEQGATWNTDGERVVINPDNNASILELVIEKSEDGLFLVQGNDFRWHRP